MMCYAMLCYDMQCYKVLLYAILSYTVLYCSVLYRTVLYLYDNVMFSDATLSRRRVRVHSRHQGTVHHWEPEPYMV